MKTKGLMIPTMRIEAERAYVIAQGREISVRELSDFAKRKGWSGTVGFLHRDEHGCLLQIDVSVAPEDFDSVLGELQTFIDERGKEISDDVIAEHVKDTV